MPNAINGQGQNPNYVIPGFDKFPPWSKPTAGLPIPIPFQFIQASCRLSEFPEKLIPKPFTKSWRNRWLSVSGEVSEHSKEKFSEFYSGSGLCALKDLADRGCNPDFIMSIFTRYLWDETIPQREATDPNCMPWHLENLRAVQTVQDLFKRHTWERTTETRIVDKALQGLEEIVQSYVDQYDFRIGRKLQNDKNNRVIFALYHHLVSKTPGVGPHWHLMLNLLVAAGAVSINSTKRAKNLAPSKL
jgi:hypothetical protein